MRGFLEHRIEVTTAGHLNPYWLGAPGFWVILVLAAPISLRMLWQKKCCETSSLPWLLGSRLPELLAQHALERLPGGRPRYGLGEVHPLGKLVTRQLTGAVPEHVLVGERCVLSHHHRDWRLAPLGRGRADHGHLGHPRMAEDDVLDLGRIDVLATRDNHVLDPVVD